MKKTRRTFSPEFKLEAVALAKRDGFSATAAALNVSEPNLRNWAKLVSERGHTAFAPLAERTDAEAELRKLKEENRQLRLERDILKKATAFFAKENE